MRTFALALLAAVAAAAAKEVTGPAVGAVMTSKINLEAATSTKTTTVTVGGEATYAAVAANGKNDQADLAVCFAQETDKAYYCAAATFVQLADAGGNVYTATVNINVLKSTTKPAAADFSDAALYASSGSANFKASKYTQVATPTVSSALTVTSANTAAATFGGTATGTDKDSWTWGAANTTCTSNKVCKFKATRAKAAADEKAANAELEAVRTFAKTTVSAAALAKDIAAANPTWAHADAADTDLTAGVAAAAAAAAGAMSLGAVAAAIATLSMAF